MRHDIATEQSKRTAESKRRELNGPHHYQWTYVKRTRAQGWAIQAFAFDLVFVREPMMTYGSSLVGLQWRGFVPYPGAVVQRWLIDPKGKGYLGAVVLFTVNLGFDAAYGADLPGQDVGGSEIAPVVIAHMLTFSGMGKHRTKSETSTAAHLVKDARTGISEGLF